MDAINFVKGFFNIKQTRMNKQEQEYQDELLKQLILTLKEVAYCDINTGELLPIEDQPKRFEAAFKLINKKL